MTNPVTLTDRSRQITYQDCPRERYLGYHHPTPLGRIGLRKTRLNIPLATGIYTHLGLADLLRGLPVDEAVKHATDEYWTEIQRRGIQVQTGEDGAYVAVEQTAWVEAALRAYALVRLPQLLAEYEVVDVEREMDLPLDEGLIMMSRRDALLRHRETGELVIQSYKTAAAYDERTARQGEHDVQGLSEMAAADYRGEERISAIRMEYLIKGPRREYPKDSGHWEQYSPLIRGYAKPGITSADDKYGWKRDFTGADGKDRRLDYRTWMAFHVWQAAGGVKAWIELLASGQVQPEAGDCLSEQFVIPQLYYRQDDDLRDWYEQTTAQELGIVQALNREPHLNSAAHRNWLNTNFPQHRQNCDYPGPCQFTDICFSTNLRQDPLGSGLYQPRVPHHEQELVQITGETK